MSQAEYRQHGRPAGKSRALTLFFLIMLLCLASFATGLMVGKSGKCPQKVCDTESSRSVTPDKILNDSTASTDTRYPAGEKPALVAEQTVSVTPQKFVPDSVGGTSADDGDSPSAGVAEKLSRVQKTEHTREESGLQQGEVAPLGSGINPAKDAQAVTAEKSDTAASSSASVALPQKKNSAVPPAVLDAAAVAKQHLRPATPKVQSSVPAAGNYVVQVAAFRDKADAQRVVDKLRAEVIPAYVREVNLGEKGIWNRVLAGPVTDRAAADSLKTHIKRSVNLDGFVKKTR